MHFFKKQQLHKITKGSFSSPSIVIKLPVTKWRRAHSWGDYHMAVLLKNELEKIGYFVLIQILPEWDNHEADIYDIAIVFRGLSRYKVKPHQINIMWNISHPDDVTLDEYDDYDKVFIASNYWSKIISEQVSTPVETMLQCTDINRFKEPSDAEKNKYRHQLLFVGNSRKVYRKILSDLLPTNFPLAVYGKEWKGLIPKKYIKAKHILNNELYKYYGSADILLNDHWDDMRNKGFISNRIFDGLACGAFIISDKVRGMEELESFIQTYKTPEELKKQISFYLEHPQEKVVKSQKGMAYIIKNHTFKERAKQFSKNIQTLIKVKAKSQ